MDPENLKQFLQTLWVKRSCDSDAENPGFRAVFVENNLYCLHLNKSLHIIESKIVYTFKKRGLRIIR